MATTEPRPATASDQVFNQSPPLEGYNAFDGDRVLSAAADREGADWARDRLREFGAVCGRPDVIELGRLANENRPQLRTHDRFGNRIDEVEFHPAWHELMRIGISRGLHASPWREPRPGAHVARGAMNMLMSQVDSGVLLPDLDDLLGRPGAAHAAGARRGVGAALRLARVRRRAARAGDRQEGRAVRDGHDREAGRLGRAGEHHHGPPAERRRSRAPSTRSPGTSGSSRRRCATSSSCSRRPTAASRAS